MPGPQPKTPSKTPEYAPPCDPALPLRALDHRREHQLMSEDAFRSYNVSVWLMEKNGVREYVAAHNQTIRELDRKVKRKADNPARVGFHAEVIAGQEIYRRQDVLRGETVVRQIFTERIPCSECAGLLRSIPLFRNVPRYYYLMYQDREWQRKQGIRGF